MNVTGFDRDLGAHRLQTLDVLINRPRTDGAAARQRYLGFTETRQQWTEYQNRCAHGLDQLVRCFQFGDVAAVEGDAVAVFSDAQTHLPHQLQDGRHILQMRNVRQLQIIGRQQTCAQNRQCRILGAGNGDFTGEALAAAN